MHDFPLGLEALRLLALHADRGKGGLLHFTAEPRIEGLAAFISAAAPQVEVHVFPAWDCLPYDTASPSREAMGRRMAALREIAEAAPRAPLVLTTPEAALQRVPPQTTLECLSLAVGRPFDPEALDDFCQRRRYLADDRVDEAGEVAFRGEVIDIFPPACRWPYRLEIGDGRLARIRSYDPATQRSIADAETLTIDPASELPGGGEEPEPGAEHWLPNMYPALETLFDYLPEAAISDAPGAGRALDRWLETIAESYRDKCGADTANTGNGSKPLPPERLYLTREEWQAAAGERRSLEADAFALVPAFVTARRPRSVLRNFLAEQRAEGMRTALVASSTEVLARMTRRLGMSNGGNAPAAIQDIDELRKARSGTLHTLLAPLEQGFIDLEAKISVIAAADFLGSHATGRESGLASASLWQVEASEFHLGDIAIHLEHGAGALVNLESLPGDSSGGEAIRLEYAEEQILLLPAAEAGRLWRYGSSESDIALDKLNGEAWPKRRAKIFAAIAETARGLVAAAEERSSRKARKLQPPRSAYERFVSRFPFAATPDQKAAVEAVLDDLGSGRPMNRLVVGDVGFGKTEVALRAAAAAALAGAQVAVVAPTTVLARQHYETFRRRFAGFEVEVAHLSRLVAPKEARQIKVDLAEGKINLVVGTHALMGKDVNFADLGLLVIDEEQRFGAQHKRKLRDLGSGVHTLSMTATPIPRTLQSALVGLQDLSPINTPPLRRRPIRTLLGEHSPASLRQALLREKRRGGQSFVVVPRVDDIEPTADMLHELLPQLKLVVAHGQMPAREVDEAMVGFASGRGDILLATSIIESGLDVPRANTMIMLRPDLFGLAQLHQLRGRVGRSHLQAYCYLMSEPGRPLSDEAARRLGSLQALDRLGAGMAISFHDLDLRGAGDLFGDKQAGHIKLIGLGLYQDLLAGAVRAAKGEPEESEDVGLQIEAEGFIPEDYVPESIMRINLYHRLARVRRPEDVDELADEIADRFGPHAEPVSVLLAAAGVRTLARSLGIVRVSAGPNGIALHFETNDPPEGLENLEDTDWNGERIFYRKVADTASERLQLVLDLLRRLT